MMSKDISVSDVIREREETAPPSRGHTCVKARGHATWCPRDIRLVYCGVRRRWARGRIYRGLSKYTKLRTLPQGWQETLTHYVLGSVYM